MNALIPKLKPENRALSLVAVAAVILVLLLATAALGDAIDDSLPADAPQAAKASARQAVQSGLSPQSVVTLTRAMLQHNFDQQQIQMAHALMIEAKNSGMPVEPLMNKAFEGMAKNVSPPLIVSAMETVQSRNAFAFQRAAQLAHQKSRTENLGRTLAAGLAAGLSKEDADKITKMVQQRAGSMNSDQAYSLALECFQTARDASRLGVSSQAVTGMVTTALAKGFNHEDMHALHNSFVTQAQQSEPQNLARGYTSAIQEGRGFQAGFGGSGGSASGSGAGAGGGGGSGSGSGGGSGGGGGSGSGSGGGSGGSGGPGGGSGGGPDGGPGGNQ
jgi:hypothetical protein